ncbi:MAG TPA: acetyl-CoA carboxylase biotin carboxyl carrier protein subunit [Bacteroidales bacterium]
MEDNANDGLKTIIIDNVKYKTRLTNKFLSRKPYEPVDPKIITAIIPGTIRKVSIKDGSKVKKGDILLELEAMKMLNNIRADMDGVIYKVLVKTGESVSRKQILFQFK